MRFLSRHFRELNDRYQGTEGDRFAAEELLPVARRFLPVGGRALEIGCGYGRNLTALADLPATVVGCDPSAGELARARRRVAEAGIPCGRVSLVRQEPYRLPFRDGTFDLVVLWQVLEHVYGRDAKQRVISECVRVLKSGGHVLVETPNQWFPFDYHDNKFPLVHWIAPPAVREWITWKVRGKRYPPSEYLSLRGLGRLIRSAPGVVRAERATAVYFAPSYAAAWRGLAGTQVALKRLIFAALAPVHAVLRGFGGTADALLPSLRVVWRVEKRT